jgi:hypothetical protein
MREHLLSWLARRSATAEFELSERMGIALEKLFGLVEKELGQVAEEDLDPRFIQLFLVRVNGS